MGVEFEKTIDLPRRTIFFSFCNKLFIYCLFHSAVLYTFFNRRAKKKKNKIKSEIQLKQLELLKSMAIFFFSFLL